ncbi:MAG: hypothetical protein GYB67_10530 [Chloroflexi bacterium]|nr:hypothetical protein [Chloroflexota bacterium]
MAKQAEATDFYPDVLGLIANDQRITLDKLQMAVGVFPRQVYLNQPVEVVVLLQNLVAGNMDVKVAVQVPTKNRAGEPAQIMQPKKMVAQPLKGGEVGVLRLPVVPLPSTTPGEILLRVAVRQRARRGEFVRAPIGGPPPSMLAVSDHKLHALRDIQFVKHPANQSPESVAVRFNIVSKRRMPDPDPGLKPLYEPLWTRAYLEQERGNRAAMRGEARKVALGISRQQVFYPLVDALEARYEARGLPLHPGESHAMAKVMVYAFDESLIMHQAVSLEATRWFQTLCQVLAHDPAIAAQPPEQIVGSYLFEAALYDAVLVGFELVGPRIDIELGGKAEQISFANRLMQWLAGAADADTSFIYLPLVMAGVIINHVITGQDDAPWDILREVDSGFRGRLGASDGGSLTEIAALLEPLLARAQDDLRRSGISQY